MKYKHTLQKVSSYFFRILRRILLVSGVLGIFFFGHMIVALKYPTRVIPNGFRMESVIFYKGKFRGPLEAVVIKEKDGTIVVPISVSNVQWTDNAVYGYRDYGGFFYYSREDKRLREFGADEEAFNAFLAQKNLPKYWSKRPWTIVR